MSRPPVAPDRDSLPPGELDDYDMVIDRNAGKLWGELPPYHAALLNSPPFGAALNRLGRVARMAAERPGTYSHADREFVDQVLSAHWGTNVVLGMHIPDALAVGVRPEAIDALRARREEDLTEDEALLAGFIRQVVDGAVTDELYGRIEERLGGHGVVEYTIFIAFLQMTIRLFQAFGIPAPTSGEIDTMLREFADGTRELPEPEARFG